MTRVANDKGTGPMGMDRGPNTHSIAAIKAVRVRVWTGMADCFMRGLLAAAQEGGFIVN